MDQPSVRPTAADSFVDQVNWNISADDYRLLSEPDDIDTQTPTGGDNANANQTGTRASAEDTAMTACEAMLGGDPPAPETAVERQARVVAALNAELTARLPARVPANFNPLIGSVLQPLALDIINQAFGPETAANRTNRGVAHGLLLRWLTYETGTRSGLRADRGVALPAPQLEQLTRLLEGWRPREVAAPAPAAVDNTRLAVLLQSPALRDSVMQHMLDRMVRREEAGGARPYAHFTQGEPSPLTRLARELTTSIMGARTGANGARHDECVTLVQRYLTRQLYESRYDIHDPTPPADRPPLPPALSEEQSRRLGELLQNGRPAANPFAGYVNADGLAAHMRANPERADALLTLALGFNPAQANRNVLALIELQAAAFSTDLNVTQVARLSLLSQYCQTARINLPAEWPADNAGQQALITRLAGQGIPREYAVMMPFVIATRSAQPVMDTTTLTADQLRELGIQRSTDNPAVPGLRRLTAAQISQEFSPAQITRTIMTLHAIRNRPGVQDQLNAWLRIYQANFNCHRFEP